MFLETLIALSFAAPTATCPAPTSVAVAVIAQAPATSAPEKAAKQASARATASSSAQVTSAQAVPTAAVTPPTAALAAQTPPKAASEKTPPAGVPVAQNSPKAASEKTPPAGVPAAQTPPKAASEKSPAAGAPIAQTPAQKTPPGDASAAPSSPEKTAATPPAAKKSAPAPIAPDVKALVDRMQAFYEKTQDFQASFTQSYRYARMKRVQESSGTVTYLKPGLMRWEYEQPAKKTFVLAGDKVYAYDPAAMQLTRGKMDTSQLSASVTFLFGQGRLADEFSITRAACDKCVGALLELTPLEKDPRFKKIFLEVDQTTAQVLRSTVVDPDGSENTIRFVELKTNVGVKQDTFKLEPAPGTEIIDLTKLGTPQQP